MNKNISAEKLNKCFLFIFAGMLYAVIIQFTGFGIPCLFNKITGLKCPGCGITRGIMSCLHGNFIQGIKYNPPVILGSPVILYFLYQNTIKEKYKLNTIEKIILYIYITVLFIYTVLRNIGIFY